MTNDKQHSNLVDAKNELSELHDVVDSKIDKIRKLIASLADNCVDAIKRKLAEQSTQEAELHDEVEEVTGSGCEPPASGIFRNSHGEVVSAEPTSGVQFARGKPKREVKEEAGEMEDSLDCKHKIPRDFGADGCRHVPGKTCPWVISSDRCPQCVDHSKPEAKPLVWLPYPGQIAAKSQVHNHNGVAWNYRVFFCGEWKAYIKHDRLATGSLTACTAACEEHERKG